MIKFSNFFETNTFRILRYFTLNGIFAVSIYYGLVENIDGAANIAIAIGWLTGLIGTVVWAAFMVDGDKMARLISESADGPPKLSVPAWFDIGFDIAVAVMFLWYGYVFLCFIYVLHILGGWKIRTAERQHTFNLLKNGVDNND